MNKLEQAGLEGQLKNTVLGHAVDLAVGLDERQATDAGARRKADLRALDEAEKLRATLALVDGPVAASLTRRWTTPTRNGSEPTELFRR